MECFDGLWESTFAQSCSSRWTLAVHISIPMQANRVIDRLRTIDGNVLLIHCEGGNNLLRTVQHLWGIPQTSGSCSQLGDSRTALDELLRGEPEDQQG